MKTLGRKAMSQPDPRTPVLVGAGVAMQREEDPARAREPIELMITAARRAAAEAGCPDLLRKLGSVSVPKGRWDYGNAPGAIALAVGADHPATVLATVGVLQQTLIGQACQRIASGEDDVALVVGGEAGYRLHRAKLAGIELSESKSVGDPDLTLAPTAELRHPAELRAGLTMPVGIYAMIDSAYRRDTGASIAARCQSVAHLYSRFSSTAAANPRAWRREELSPTDIVETSERNPMIAFPYTRRQCSSWSVDQAAALLLCSVETARRLGVPSENWIFPLASAESNHMVEASARSRLAASPGARIAAFAALDHAGLAAEEIDLVDLYSPFPIAVQLYAAEAGLSLDRDLTVTGGMPFAGGPYNNYVLQATARVVELMRSGNGETALVSCASGVLTKQAFGVWSTVPGETPFAFIDVSDRVAHEMETKDVVLDHSGRGTVAAYTVIFDRGAPARGIAIVDVDDGARRAVAVCEDPAMLDTMQREEFNGRSVDIDAGSFSLAEE